MFLRLTLTWTSFGYFVSGAMANIVDLAPNLAGPVLAFAQTIHMSASFLSPMVNGIILTDQKNLKQWQLCFLISSVVAIVTYIMFQLYGTADVQPWNYPAVQTSDTERQQLNKKKDSKKNHDTDDS